MLDRLEIPSPSLTVTLPSTPALRPSRSLGLQLLFGLSPITIYSTRHRYDFSSLLPRRLGQRWRRLPPSPQPDAPASHTVSLRVFFLDLATL
jgi:hypothetical protein